MNKEEVKETIESTKDLAMDTAKETVKKAKASAKKATKEAKKVTEKATKAAKKEVTKLMVRETYIQFAGAEYKESDIMAKVEAAFTAQGHRFSSVKSIELYIKPEDGAAYYVINDKITGKVSL